MSRLPPAQPRGLDPIRRLALGFSRRTFGRDVEPTGALAHHRPLLLGFGGLSLAMDRYANALPPRLKHLAMVRAAQLVGCEWCLDFGSYLAVQSGIAEDDLRALASWRTSERFNALDRLVLEYADAMTRTPVGVSDELFGRLREHLDERQLVELTLAISVENMYSRTNWALGIEGQGFSAGTYCVRPAALEVETAE